MTEERKPREKSLRNEEARASDSWVPASILPDPAPQDGWLFRWVRTSTLGESDNTHVSRMLLLCKAPSAKMESRTKHFQQVSQNQMDSVDQNYLRENDPRMPLLNPERSSKTTFGRS